MPNDAVARQVVTFDDCSSAHAKRSCRSLHLGQWVQTVTKTFAVADRPRGAHHVCRSFFLLAFLSDPKDTQSHRATIRGL